MSDYQRRIARLQKSMRDAGVGVTVLAATDNMRYLTGWAEHGHERLIALFVPAEGAPAFVTPTMNAPQAASNEAGIEQVVGWDDATGWEETVQGLFREREILGGAGKTALIDDEMASVHTLRLQALFPELKYEPAGATMARLREIKTPQELAALQRAAHLIDAIVAEIPGLLIEGMTETELQDLIYATFKREGTRASFTPLICFGSNCALPHHSSGPAHLQPGDTVILDIGCVSGDYASDITRTISYRSPRDQQAMHVYEIVYQAHLAAMHAVRPGVTGEAVDAAARGVIDAAGYGPYFVHRTGHGIGISVHEPPYIVGGNGAPLREGMCFSIEPGIYLPGRFGVRIENIVTVTADGARSLNAAPEPTLRIVEV